MKFDEYIQEKQKSLGLVVEADSDVQEKNVFSQFFKNLGTVLRGGKPADPPKIELKKPQEVDKLRTILKPTYAEAVKALESEALSSPVVNNKVNANLIVSNLVKVFETAAITRNTQSETDVYNLLQTKPDISREGSKAGKRDVQDFGELSSDQILSQVKEILQPALDAGILKWDIPVRELSPKDLFNRVVNKLSSETAEAAKQVLSSDTFARM